MALGALRHGCVEGVEGLQSDAELADKGLNQASRGGEDTLSGRQGGGRS
jgi:hypothetical protein